MKEGEKVEKRESRQPEEGGGRPRRKEKVEEKDEGRKMDDGRQVGRQTGGQVNR